MHLAVLVTGARSGLGAALARNWSNEKSGSGRLVTMTRENAPEILENRSNQVYDVIVHCAMNSELPRPGRADAETEYRYWNDNVFLTQKLVQIPHRYFVYLSSIDVYPPSRLEKQFGEWDSLDYSEPRSSYAVSKLISESICRQHARSSLILRPAALLGATSRPSSVVKILSDPDPTVSLTGDSRFNLVAHQDLIDFIELAIERRLTGIYNIASESSITLDEVAKMVGKKVKFGSYRYQSAEVDARRLWESAPAFKKSSREVVEGFLRAYQKNRMQRPADERMKEDHK